MFFVCIFNSHNSCKDPWKRLVGAVVEVETQQRKQTVFQRFVTFFVSSPFLVCIVLWDNGVSMTWLHYKLKTRLEQVAIGTQLLICVIVCKVFICWFTRSGLHLCRLQCDVTFDVYHVQFSWDWLSIQTVLWRRYTLSALIYNGHTSTVH